MKCANCKSVLYCNRECQKADWKKHKTTCKQINPGTGEVDLVASNFEELQALVLNSSTENGATIKLIKGSYDSSAPLIINKAITIVGVGSSYGEDNSVINTNIIAENITSGKMLRLKDLKGTNGLTVKGTVKCKNIELTGCRFERPNNTQHDCVELNHDCTSNTLIVDCEIYGGNDGLTYQSKGSLTIRSSEIRFAQDRGIFANNYFTIENSEVSNCGGYGMKTRGGCLRLGDNDIQPGPWDNLPF